jgi:gluconolactonase
MSTTLGRFGFVLVVAAATFGASAERRPAISSPPPVTMTILQDRIDDTSDNGPAESDASPAAASEDPEQTGTSERGRGVSAAGQPEDGREIDLDQRLESPLEMRLDRIEELLADRRYEDLDTEQFFPRRQLRTVKDVVFLEGPACDAEGNVYFSNIPFERIMRWDASTRRLSVFREASNAANGLAFDRQGRLLICEGGKQRVTRLDVVTGRLEVLADNCKGRPLGRPNDVCLDNRGRIYFTARFGSHLAPGQRNAVYRIDPDGSLERLVASPDVDMPNGLATSPDDSVLYVVDANGNRGRARCIRAFPLSPEGSLGEGQVLFDFYPGRSGDGMAVDAEGNLYVAAGLHHVRGSSETLDTRPGIHVISPTGKLLAYVETPEDTLTNCTFGGPDLHTLYITCGKKLMALRTAIPGKPLYRPEQ